jgi:ABC-type multidrug transport system fused ATPase/permease subunit
MKKDTLEKQSAQEITLFDIVVRLWAEVSRSKRLMLIALFFLMLLSSFAEVLSLGAVLPFLGVLTNPQTVLQSKILAPAFQVLGIESAQDLILPMCLIFGFAIALANALRMLTFWVTTRLSYAVGFDLSASVYRKVLYQDYEFHVSKNSSEVMAGISKAGGLIYTVVIPCLNLINSALMIVCIFIALLVIDWKASLSTFIGFAVLYSLVMWFANKHLIYHGEQINKQTSLIIKVQNEGLGGIRDVLIDGLQEIYSKSYQAADLRLRRASGSNAIISIAPHYAIETLAVLLILVVAYYLALAPKGILSAIPILGVLVLSAQRVMPLVQQFYSSLSVLRGNASLSKNALFWLNLPAPALKDVVYESDELTFEKSINFQAVCFKYLEGSNPVITNFTYEIPKGSVIGLMGKTGSGKSTLVDILMGLLEPTSGFVQIDGVTLSRKTSRSWQNKIAHVPQHIYLADISIAENIAFGMPFEKIDMKKIQECLIKADLVELVSSWPEGVNTIVGERGVRLSGGQRQRIGIARALYKDAEVIIFDEATSALDYETEAIVMNSINNLGLTGKQLTIFMVAHRLSTLKHCDKILEIEKGQLKSTHKFDDIEGSVINK